MQWTNGEKGNNAFPFSPFSNLELFIRITISSNLYMSKIVDVDDLSTVGNYQGMPDSEADLEG